MFRKNYLWNRCNGRSALRGAVSLLLALTLAAGLTACGRENSQDDGGGAEALSGTVYVPDFIDLPLSYVDGCCSDGENVYILGQVREEQETTDPVTGETRTEEVSRSAILCVSKDGGEAQELANYEPMAVPEGMEGYSGSQTIQAGPDGTLWVKEYLSYYRLDLPEDFDEENDNYWDYMTDQVSMECQRQLDATGSEIKRVDITDLDERLAPEDAGEDNTEADGMMFDYGYTSDLVYDAYGNAYLITGNRLCVLDGDMQLRFALDAENVWNEPVLLGDGTVGIRSNYSDPITGAYGYQIQTVDVEAQDWGDTWLLPDGVYDIYPGGGEYLFYYLDGDILFGCKAEDAVTGENGKREAQGEELFSWLDADINANQIDFFTFLSDGRVAVMSHNYDRMSDWRFELAILTETERAALPEKTTITYGAMGLSYDDRSRIIAFNRDSDRCRIEVIDYAQYNTDNDPTGGLTRLSTEIVAGKIPDIIATDNMPISQLEGRGMLEDLWPYIENDPDLGREALMEHVFDVASDEEGRLHRVFPEFSIKTVMGAPGVVGDRTSWTLSDLQAALATMPEGCTILRETDTAPGMLTDVLAQDLKDFVDWETGKCSFDSEDFKNILSFCASFPASFDLDSYDYQNADEEPVRVSEGRQLLMQLGLNGFEDIQIHKAIFGGSVSYIGYPMEDGSCGSSFILESGLAMSAACADKDGAWSFMRQLLLPQYSGLDPAEHTLSSMNGSFPTNKADFDFMSKAAMTPQYRKDADGNLILDENGEPIEYSTFGYSYGTSISVEVMATTQEEVDQIMSLYEDIERVYDYDQRVLDIVSDVAGSYFAGDTDLDTAAANIQSRVSLYINENR